MGFFIAGIGFISIIAGIVGFIILFILKKPKKIAILLLAIGALLYLVGALLTPPDELGTSDTLEILTNSQSHY